MKYGFNFQGFSVECANGVKANLESIKVDVELSVEEFTAQLSTILGLVNTLKDGVKEIAPVVVEANEVMSAQRHERRMAELRMQDQLDNVRHTRRMAELEAAQSPTYKFDGREVSIG